MAHHNTRHRTDIDGPKRRRYSSWAELRRINVTTNTPPNGFYRSRTVWGVLALAFVLRALLPLLAAAVTQDTSVYQAPDTVSYVKPARELAATGSFTSNGLPEIMRSPGYPLLLVPGILAGRLELVTIGLQILLGCATVYFVYKIALLLFDKSGIAAACALLCALDPLLIIYTSKLLTETLSTCLTAAFVYWLLRYLKDDAPGRLVVSAVILAASVYVRPINYFLPVLVASGLLIRALCRRPRARRLFAHAGIFLATSMAPVGLWQVRNLVETGYGGFSAISDVTLYFYHGAAVLAAEHGASYYETQREMGYTDEEVYLEQHPEQRGWSPARRYRYMRNQGMRVLARRPWTYARIHVKGMARALLDPGAFDWLKMFNLYPQSGGGLLGSVVDKGMMQTVGELFRERPLLFWSNLALGLVLASYLLLAAVGAISRGVLRSPGVVVILLVGIYFLAVSGGPQAECRFRHPLMPLLCVLAGAGLSAIAGKFGRMARTPAPAK